jgi:hypothetical protein
LRKWWHKLLTRSAYQMMTLNLIQMMVPSVYSNFHKTMHIVMLLTTSIWYVCSKDVLAKCFLEHKMSIQSFNKNSLFTWKQTLEYPLLSNNLLSSKLEIRSLFFKPFLVCCRKWNHVSKQRVIFSKYFFWNYQ